MADVYCAICRKPLAPGALKFLVTINVAADFDGTLPADCGIEDLEAFMRKIDRADPRKLEHDVYQSKGYLLCPECKMKFMRNPLGVAAEKKPAEPEGRVH
jgi:hypothetical protein